MRQETFVAITKEFSLPLSYIRMLKEGSTVFLEVPNVSNNPNGDIQSTHPVCLCLQTPGIDEEALDFMIQNSFTSTTQFSVALAYDPKRCLTNALVHSLSESEINSLIQDVIAHQENVALPTLLPSLLLAFRVGSASTKVRDCHQQIAEIEHETGIQANWHPNQRCCSVHRRQSAGVNRYDEIDFDRVTGQLTGLSSKLAYCEFVSEVHLPMLDSLNKINSRLLGNAYCENKDTLSRVEARLLAENNFLQTSLQGTLVRARYLSKRSQAQVQTVRPTNHLHRLATHIFRNRYTA